MAFQTRDPSQAIITSVGSALNGDVLFDTLPVIRGTADAGNVVEIYDGVRFLGTTVAAADGVWSFTLVIPLKAGLHKFASIGVDSENNRGASSEVLSVVLSLPVVPAPSITGFLDHAGLSIVFDSATTESHLQVTGTGRPADVITVFDGAHLIGSAVTDSAGAWSLTPAVALTDGTHDFHAVASNAAGSQSAQSNHAGISIDTSTPGRAIINAVTDNVGPIQGPVDRGGLTDDALPIISGTGKAGNIITLYDQTTLLGTAHIDANGIWSIQPADSLAPSVHALTAIESTKAGTQGSPSAIFIFFVDTAHVLSAQASVLHDVAPDGPLDSAHTSGTVSSHHVFDTALGLKLATTKSSIVDPEIGQHGALKLSLADVLPPAESGLFQRAEPDQVRALDKSGLHTEGLDEAQWRLGGMPKDCGPMRDDNGHLVVQVDLLPQSGVDIVFH
ncbi:Ig-like domain-containing protein [Caballeronia sp. DA-9]|uniref:Ig-like domain-containing protein n=1 Tax=Caballeronia sp. DA-9 TaxID=3436237 RepID=UPI003F66E0F0